MYDECRICPGRHMATSILWITIASILSTFDIRKAVGKDREVVEPTYEYFPGLVSCVWMSFFHANANAGR
jgi:hypothetical protein